MKNLIISVYIVIVAMAVIYNIYTFGFIPS